MIKKILLATALAAAFFFAGVRFCVLAQHIEVVGHNGDDYVCTVEVFGREDYHFAAWKPLARTDAVLVDTRATAAEMMSSGFVSSNERAKPNEYHFAEWSPLPVKENNCGVVDAYTIWEV